MNWDDVWVTRSKQELRIQVAERRLFDPELTDFENDLPASIAQAKFGVHARMHFPPTTREGASVDEINDRNIAPLTKLAT